MGAAFKLRHASQRTAVTAHRQRLDQFHAQPLEERHERLDRVIIQMLVVNRVEQRLLEHIDQVRNLKDKHAVRREQGADSLHNAFQIVDISEDIVSGNDFRLAILSSNLLCQFRAEKSRQGFDALPRGFFRDAACRVNAQHLHARRLKKTQQRAVVRADVQHQASGRGLEPGEDVPRIGFEMRHETRRSSGNVNVVLKENGRVDDVEQLDVPAIFAEKNVQRKTRLGFFQFIARNEGIGRRRGRQIQNERQPVSATQPAGLAAMAQWFCGGRVQSGEGVRA